MITVASTLARAWRGLREHTYLAFVGAGVITAALLVLGLFGLVAANLRAALGAWEEDVHVSAWFVAGTSPEVRETTRAAVAARPEVLQVTYVSEADARAWMKERVPEVDAVVAELGDDVLPASLEITLRERSPVTLAQFAQTLQATGAFSLVDYGEEWVQRFQTFLHLLGLVGVVFGLVVSAATVLMVANTVHLAVHARRDEIEILRLVGATDGYILGPFLVEGAVQGTVGAVVALIGLRLLERGLLSRLHDTFAAAFGGQEPASLPVAQVVAILLGGALLGLVAAWAATRRFLARVP